MSGTGSTTVPGGRRRRRGLALGLAGVLAVGAAAVAVDVAGAPSAGAAALVGFGSCEELTAWYRDTALAQVGPWGLDGGGGGMVGLERAAVAESVGGAPAAPQAAAAGAAGLDAAATGGAVGSSGSGVNVQEEGVDEPSRVALAGGLAYTLTDRRLVVVDTTAGSVVGAVELGTGGDDGRWSSELLLLGDRVVVLGTASLPAPAGAPGGAIDGAIGGAIGDGTSGRTSGAATLWAPSTQPAHGAATTTMTTVDVRDPAAPAVVARTEVEGGYVSARASDGVVRVVTTSSPVLPFVDPWLLQQQGVSPDAPLGDDMAAYPVEPDPRAEAEARERNEQVVRDATAADWLPDLVQRDADGTVTSTAPVPCDAVAHPGEASGTGTLTVLSLDPSADEPLQSTTSVSADGSVVYASTDRLYVATMRGGWTWGPAATGGQDRTSTELHGFSTAAVTTSYLGSGSVDGWLLGSWAMDASEGHLRVGTTSQAPGVADGGPGTSSSVVVLRETGDGLVEAGRVDGLGPGEQIRSLRWFDDLAVVVTFEQTDPLYTVDLADPAAPRVLGELKVTGYSGYLHPVGDGVLLGVGQAGDEAGTLLGTKVETYDVRDLASPRVVADVVWPGSSSPTEWDSRLFAYLPGQRTAVLPLEEYDQRSGASRSGLVAVALDGDGTPREAGRWTAAEAGSTQALATDGDLVAVQREAWLVVEDIGGGDSGDVGGDLGGDTAVQAPRRTLALLDADDLTVRTVVDLG